MRCGIVQKRAVVFLILLMLIGTASAVTTTIYPTSDGDVIRDGNPSDYADLLVGAGTSVDTSSDNGDVHLTTSNAGSHKFAELRRGVYSFNTSTLPDNAVISSVIFSQVSGTTVTDLGTPGYGISSGWLANNSAIAADDYNRTGSLELAPRIQDAAFPVSGRVNWTFNSTGLSWVNKTGFTVMFLRDGWDLNGTYGGDTEAGWAQSKMYENFVEKALVTDRPFLEVTYTLPQPTIYPVPFINETRYLPFSDTNLPAAGLNISLNATPGEYEEASFIVKPSAATTDMTLSSSALSDGAGHTIPNTSINLRTLKVWYQADANEVQNIGAFEYLLTPELLLKNDSVISCNYTNQNCSVWISNVTFNGYFDVSNTTADLFPTDAAIYDNATASGDPQPFSLTTNENRQIVATVNVPAGQTAGTYTGTITVASSTHTTVAVNLSVVVLPFTLGTSNRTQALYYRGKLRDSGTGYQLGCSADGCWKTNAQYSAEMANMVSHGIQYPQLSGYYDTSGTDLYNAMHLMMDLRDAAGVTKGRLYTDQSNFVPNDYPNDDRLESDTTKLDHMMVHFKSFQGLATTHGYTNATTYAMAYDEVSAVNLAATRPSSLYILGNGSRMFYSTWTTDLSPSADVMNQSNIDEIHEDWATAIRAVNPNTEIFLFGYPQSGVENPELYRQHFGYEMYTSSYNGSMQFAYQSPSDGAGESGWNDYDDEGQYRDHMFTYPKTDGVIDTIEWEGYREAIDDMRYADYLVALTGSDTRALEIIDAGLAAGDDMSEIRANIIDEINDYTPPVVTATPTPLTGNVTASQGGSSIIGALTLVGIGLIGLGAILIILMFRDMEASAGMLVTGVLAIAVGAALLLITYFILNPLFILSGA